MSPSAAPLIELQPRISEPGGLTQRLEFLCPICRNTPIGIEIWSGDATTLKLAEGTLQKIWHAEQGPHKDWASLTIKPSIDAVHGFSGTPPRDCNGWHGYITNGVCA